MLSWHVQQPLAAQLADESLIHLGLQLLSKLPSGGSLLKPDQECSQTRPQQQNPECLQKIHSALLSKELTNRVPTLPGALPLGRMSRAR